MQLARFLAVCVVASISTAHGQVLTFHNSLDSEAAIFQSVVGPPLADYTGQAPWIPTVTGTRAYVPGVVGSALTLGPAPYNACCRAYSTVLMNHASVMNSEHGTIEAWYLNRGPLWPYVNNSHVILGSIRECGWESGLSFSLQKLPWFPTTRVFFGLELCGTPVYAHSLSDGQQGFALPATDRWCHLAAVWDRAGIDGSADRMRCYLNGQLVASATSGAWGTTFGWGANVGGASNWDIEGAFFLDELKIWDAAKTTFVIDPRLYAAQVDGPGSGMLMNFGGPPGAVYFTALSVDPANAGPGFGTGWFGGLHAALPDILAQWSSQTPPFVGVLDNFGGSTFSGGAGAFAALSGTTFYAVTFDLDPTTGVAHAWTPPQVLTIN